MDFNSIFRPFQSVKDIAKGFLLSRLIPSGITERHELLTKFFESDRSDIAAFTEKIDTTLPEFGDDISQIVKNMDSHIPTKIVEEMASKGVAVRHLIPPVNSCCGNELILKSSSKCEVYEKLQTTSGIIYSGSCKKCKTVYYHSYYKTGGTMKYYSELTSQFFQSTRETVFEISFLKAADRNM